MGILIGAGISIAIVLISLIFRLAKLLHLTVPLLYIVIVKVFFNDWYIENTLLAQIILSAIVGIIIINLIASICRRINEKRVERNRAELDAILNSERLYYRKRELNGN